MQAVNYKTISNSFEYTI